MTTQIETTDYIHSTGLPMVSLKTVTTELPEGWGDGYSESEREAMLSKMHAADIKIEEYRGLLAEGRGDPENLSYAVARLEDAGDADNYISLCEDIARYGIDKFAEQ